MGKSDNMHLAPPATFNPMLAEDFWAKYGTLERFRLEDPNSMENPVPPPWAGRRPGCQYTCEKDLYLTCEGLNQELIDWYLWIRPTRSELAYRLATTLQFSDISKKVFGQGITWIGACANGTLLPTDGFDFVVHHEMSPKEADGQTPPAPPPQSQWDQIIEHLSNMGIADAHVCTLDTQPSNSTDDKPQTDTKPSANKPTTGVSLFRQIDQPLKEEKKDIPAATPPPSTDLKLLYLRGTLRNTGIAFTLWWSRSDESARFIRKYEASIPIIMTMKSAIALAGKAKPVEEGGPGQPLADCEIPEPHVVYGPSSSRMLNLLVVAYLQNHPSNTTCTESKIYTSLADLFLGFLWHYAYEMKPGAMEIHIDEFGGKLQACRMELDGMKGVDRNLKIFIDGVKVDIGEFDYVKFCEMCKYWYDLMAVERADERQPKVTWGLQHQQLCTSDYSNVWNRCTILSRLFGDVDPFLNKVREEQNHFGAEILCIKESFNAVYGMAVKLYGPDRTAKWVGAPLT